MGQYAEIGPKTSFVEVDLDPTGSDTIPSAYLSLLVYIPSSAQADILASTGSKSVVFLQTDWSSFSIRFTGGAWRWYSGAVDFGANVVFDSWNQFEWSVTNGSSNVDVRINGALTSGVATGFGAATGVNYLACTNLVTAANVGAGGGVIADDYVRADELSWAIADWVSIGGADARWSFDGADPLGDATTNYPDPPWTWGVFGNTGNITIGTNGGSLPDCFPCGADSATADSDPSAVVTAAAPPDVPGFGGSDCNVQVFLDGVDVSGVSIQGSVTRRLNRPALATIKMPMDSAFGCPGSRLQVWFDGTLYFHGMVMDLEVDSAEDDGYTVYNASDPMELWQWRVVRADDGNFSMPTGDGGVNDLFATYVTGPAIMNAVMMNTEGSTTAQGNGALNPPSYTEGPTFLNFAGYAVDGCDLTGAPTDWPQTISQLFSTLASTGCLDAVITPTDPGGGIMGDLQFYNGDYGTDLSASVILQYGMGNYTIRNVRWNQDMSNLMNKLWIYGGPRVGTSQDPLGNEHWCWNIQGQDPVFNPDATAELVPPGGTSVDSSNNPANFTNNPLGQRIYESRYTDGCYGGTFDDGYGVRMQVYIFDGLSDNCLGPGSFDPQRWLYRRLWQEESWLRAVPRDLVHVTPIAGYPIGNFDIGDIVTVEAVSTVMGGFSGAQRIYQYTISWDEDGPCQISELQTSSDVGIDTGV